MKTYRDVYLTEEGLAKTEDGYVFEGTAYKRSKLVRGVGTNDFHGVVRSKSKGIWKPYALWCGVLNRAYDSKFHARQPTYIGAGVDESWHRFSSFLSWLLEQPFHSSSFQLDKDIIGRGKFYSPEDCIMVPSWVNLLLTDNGSVRGELPLGVCRHGSGYLGQVHCGNEGSVTKTFRTIEEASTFYHGTKQAYVDSRKEELDFIDERLYYNICRILNERRPR